MVVQQRWLCGTMMSHSVFRKSRRNKNGKSGKSKSSGKSPVKSEGDPLKQRLEPNVDCVVKKVTGRKTVLKPMSMCLKPNAV